MPSLLFKVGPLNMGAPMKLNTHSSVDSVLHVLGLHVVCPTKSELISAESYGMQLEWDRSAFQIQCIVMCRHMSCDQGLLGEGSCDNSLCRQVA